MADNYAKIEYSPVTSVQFTAINNSLNNNPQRALLNGSALIYTVGYDFATSLCRIELGGPNAQGIRNGLKNAIDADTGLVGVSSTLTKAQAKIRTKNDVGT